MENNLLFITVEDVKTSPLWQPINDRKQSTYNDNLIYNSILKTSLWVDRLAGGTVSEKINKKELFPRIKKDGTGLIDYDKWLNYIQSACLLAVINWYLPKGVNDLTGSASMSQGGVAYSQTNDPEANENITKDVKNALKLAGEIIDTTSTKTFTRPYNYVSDNYAHPWEEEYKHISKKTFYPTLLFWLKNRLYSDNSINITYPTKNDFSKIDYNEYIKLVVPFDNNTIYYDNGVWKAKQSGEIPSDIIKDSDLNKNYIDKSDNKYIVKNALLTVNSETKNINDFILDLQNKIISLTQEINSMKWEFVDTSDFTENDRSYKIKNYNYLTDWLKIEVQGDIFGNLKQASVFTTHFQDQFLDAGTLKNSTELFQSIIQISDNELQFLINGVSIPMQSLQIYKLNIPTDNIERKRI